MSTEDAGLPYGGTTTIANAAVFHTVWYIWYGTEASILTVAFVNY